MKGKIIIQTAIIAFVPCMTSKNVSNRILFTGSFNECFSFFNMWYICVYKSVCF
jgi:hypothetical protein